ncbi:GPR1/FUN34/YaaH family transporter [Saccharopolyspora mangrovi]|uniref:GPR1/FUN34/YaaH family transporter n=1 Tax=Saccharopolyspora mangrovi TaxID=3082379 RepID=A0ABU6A513_9PSEU|nr:GPR1/FUN34/YaaH family transporter [Saccharopolyspora sp. S2-29]MEB3366495.1 GPR1/FUN34/YaaH family transporter [Saccharopolyspora sp. S2-29]
MTASEAATTHRETPVPQEPEPTPGPLTGDPALIGVPTFIVGSIALGMTLVGFVPAAAVGAPVAIILAATGIGQLLAAVWAAGIGQSAVASIFGIFSGFWLSYGFLVLGLTHDWFGVPSESATATQGLFLSSWFVTVALLTLATLRLPVAYTLLFGLIAAALMIVLVATVQDSTELKAVGGYVVFTFAALGCYLFFHVMSVATGGRGLPLGHPVGAGPPPPRGAGAPPPPRFASSC